MTKGYYLVIQDKTTCGGIITEGEPRHTIMGKAVAREQDRVTCGKHPGTYIIVGHIPNDTVLGRKFAGTLHSHSSCPCQARFIPSQMIRTYELREGSVTAKAASSGGSAGVSAEVASALIAALEAAKKAVTPVFAKSSERGAGNTDAGTGEEPHSNFGRMAYGIPTQVEAAPVEPVQHAQTAKRKPTNDGTKANGDLPWYKRMLGAKEDAPAQAGMPLAIPVATGGGAELAAGGMQLLRGMAIAGGQLFSAASIGVVGMLYSRPLNQGDGDLLAGSQLAALAGKSAPTRIRFQWLDAGNGRFKPVAYHTSQDSGQDQVRVRSMRENSRTGNYEFWADGATGPTIVWTPDETEFKAPANTGNREEPYQPTTITVLPLPSEEELGSTSTSLPMPDEKSFDDYILVNLPHGMPPIYIYLSKPPVKFLEVELYSDFKRRSRDGKYEADHMPSKAAAKAHLRRVNPKLDETTLEELAQDVAAIVIPKEIHQKISETYGGRNNPAQIERDSLDLRAALDRNFDTIKPALKDFGATEAQLEEASGKMHKLNQGMGLYK